MIEIIREDVLNNGSELRLRDFGTFRQKVVAARSGRNPKTGAPIQIGRSTTITFSPSDTGFRVRDA
jgi:nucleoid DNA-binding protein